MNNRTVRALPYVATIVVLCTGTVPAAAQRLVCVQPAEPAEPTRVGSPCTVTLRGSPAWEIFVLRFEDVAGRPVPRASVTVEPADAGIRVEPQTLDNGELRIEWHSGSGTGVSPRILEVTAQQGNQRAQRRIEVRPPPVRTELTLLAVPDQPANRGYWYEGHQLRDPVTVQLQNASPADCERTRVAFRAVGGSVTPDTTHGLWIGGSCLARSHWRLGRGVGIQHLRAQLVEEPRKSVEFHARARALPRVMAGLALAYADGFDRLEVTTTTLRITQQVEGLGTIARDSVVRKDSLVVQPSSWEVTPILGVDFPLVSCLPRIRTFVGASITDPRENWFVGLSALQPFYRLSHEAISFDLQAVVQVSRREVVADVPACRQDPALCATERRTRPVGGGLMLSVDSGALLSPLLTIFRR
jgi:hypothetical protein